MYKEISFIKYDAYIDRADNSKFGYFGFFFLSIFFSYLIVTKIHLQFTLI